MSFFKTYSVRRVFDYNPETGVLTWLVRLNSRIRIGSEAGTVDKLSGYRFIQVDGKKYKASRLIWLWMTGEWPAGEIDHKNRNKSDDRFSNLRDSSHGQNMRNGFWGTNSSGIKGVSWNKARAKWQVELTVNYEKKYLGLFSSFEEAEQIVIAATKKYHKEFSRTYERN